MGKIPFPMKENSIAFSKAVMNLIGELINQDLEPYSSKENRYRYHHGSGWIVTHVDSNKDISPFNQAGSNSSLSYEDIRWLDLSSLKKFIEKPAKEISESMIESLYKHVNMACEKSGNTVHTNLSSNFKEGFLELLRKIKFSVDRSGAINFPSLFVHPEMFNAIKEQLERPDEYFQSEVNAIADGKIQEAIREERERLSKYKGLSDG